MKRLALFSLLVCTACASTVYAESDTENIITFRGIPWYSTKEETENILFSEGANEHGWMSSVNNIYRLSGTDFANSTLGSDRVDGGGYMGWYSGVSVAGYDVNDTYACYIYPINENGEIVHSDQDAEFYFGWYTFKANDYSDHKAIYDDLNKKLVSLYGEGTQDATDYHTTTTWYDSQENQIRLLINTNEDYVTLGYIAADADARLDEMKTAIDAEATANEAAERESNKDNTSGL